MAPKVCAKLSKLIRRVLEQAFGTTVNSQDLELCSLGPTVKGLFPGTGVLLSSWGGGLPYSSPPALSLWTPPAGEINPHLSVPGTNGSFVVMELASACFRPQHDRTILIVTLLRFSGDSLPSH